MGLRNRNNLNEEQFYFVTTTIKNFTNIFTHDKYCNILINNLKFYQKRYKFIILAYVIMPTHFHWIVKTEPILGSISDIMRDIKKYTAWDVLKLLEEEKPELLKIFEKSVKSGQKRQFWIHRFDDQVIRTNKMFWSKLKYIHNNPVKANLVEKPIDFKYSSACNYIQKDHSIIFVDTSLSGIEII